jgi:hypothetical protein
VGTFGAFSLSNFIGLPLIPSSRKTGAQILLFISRRFNFTKFYSFVITNGQVEVRVTRLGEFSPNGRLFSLGCYMKITEASHIYWLLYSMVKLKHKLKQKYVGQHFG